MYVLIYYRTTAVCLEGFTIYIQKDFVSFERKIMI